MRRAGRLFILVVLGWAVFGVARAEEVRGPVTNLPMPRFVSMKAVEGNARRGPSTAHRIDWVFKHRGTPLMVTGEYEHWRRVQDHEGQGGWMHFRLLSGVRMALILNENTPLLRKPKPGSAPVAKLEKGVIAKLLECDLAWCRISIGRTRGWVEKTAIWGVEAEEIRE